MDKIKDITKILEKTKVEEKEKTSSKVEKVEKVTNPLKTFALQKLARFNNEKLSKKFDINDLLR